MNNAWNCKMTEHLEHHCTRPMHCYVAFWKTKHWSFRISFYFFFIFISRSLKCSGTFSLSFSICFRDSPVGCWIMRGSRFIKADASLRWWAIALNLVSAVGGAQVTDSYRPIRALIICDKGDMHRCSTNGSRSSAALQNKLRATRVDAGIGTKAKVERVWLGLRLGFIILHSYSLAPSQKIVLYSPTR